MALYSYTICFLRRGDRVLLLNREKPPWMGCWNGVGGKLRPDETVHACAVREVREETGILMSSLRPRGVVTWTVDGALAGGMYAFVGEPDDSAFGAGIADTVEGILAWKRLAWVLHPENQGVAANLRYFLPDLLSGEPACEHRCAFVSGRLEGVARLALAKRDARDLES